MNDFCTLMYHEIIKSEDFNPDNNSGIVVNQGYQDILPKPLFVLLEEFERQMEYLHANGYTTLKLQQVIDYYYNNRPLPQKAVLLTFDDMYKSVLLYAYSILKRYKFSAVGFVTLDWLFEEEKQYSSTKSVCLSREELRQMEDVFEYANHSKALHTRKDGLTALQTVDKETFTSDIKGCEEFVGVKGVYAYPFGICTEEVINWLKDLGFFLGFTTEGGRNNSDVEPLRLRRNGVFLNCDLEGFKSIVGFNKA